MVITKKQKAILTVFGLTMITIGSVDSVRNLPSTALFGSSLIFYFILAGITFLVPTALIAAELSSTWLQEGGIYLWVSEAFGKKAGFLASWYQWVENVVWYPTMLSILAGIFAFLLSPNLVNNKLYIFSIILVVYWTITFLNLLGMRASTRFGVLCSIFGLVIPMAVIISLGLVWYFSGHVLQISLKPHDLLPSMYNTDSYMALTGIILCFCGMEVTTIHIREVKQPQTEYPKALGWSVLIILITMILGSLSIAIVIPHNQISLISGTMQAFQFFLNAHHISWLLWLLSILILIGGLGSINNWIISPTKALHYAIKDIDILKQLHHQNKKEMPGRLLILQAIFVTLISAVFLIMPTINSSYWLLTALTSQLYMVMYILMFFSALHLRYKFPSKNRTFVVPGGKLGLWIACVLGILSSIVTIIIGFKCPSDVKTYSNLEYALIIGFGFILISILPFIIFLFKKRKVLQLDNSQPQIVN